MNLYSKHLLPQMNQFAEWMNLIYKYYSLLTINLKCISIIEIFLISINKYNKLLASYLIE